VLAMIAVWLACFYDWKPFLVPGEIGRIIIIAADKKQCRVILGFIMGFLQNVPVLAGMVVRETAEVIDLKNGISIEIHASSMSGVRGYSLVACLADEAAFWNLDENSANPDVEIIRSVRPALASIRGSMLLVASSPYAERGALFTAYRKHHGKENSPVLTWQAPTRTMNPSIPESLVAEAYEADPESAAAEFGALFRSRLAMFIERADIEALVDRGIKVRPPRQGVQYVAHVDASSGAGADPFCAAVGHREGDNCIVDCVIEIRPPFSPPVAVSQLSSILSSYKITRASADRWGLNFVASEFERNKIALDYSDKNSSEIFRQALPLLRSGRARLPENERMVNQFCNLERRIAPGGAERIGHPERGGHHDDIAVVVSGCLVALSSPLEGPESFLEYMRRMVEEPNKYNVDVDDIRAAGPQFGFRIGPPQWISLQVPPPIDAGGSLTFDGQQFGFRFREGKTFVEVDRDHAVQLLRGAPAWRQLNPAIAAELIEKAGR